MQDQSNLPYQLLPQQWDMPVHRNSQLPCEPQPQHGGLLVHSLSATRLPVWLQCQWSMQLHLQLHQLTLSQLSGLLHPQQWLMPVCALTQLP